MHHASSLILLFAIFSRTATHLCELFFAEVEVAGVDGGNFRVVGEADQDIDGLARYQVLFHLDAREDVHMVKRGDHHQNLALLKAHCPKHIQNLLESHAELVQRSLRCE